MHNLKNNGGPLKNIPQKEKNNTPLVEEVLVSPAYAMTIYSLCRAQNTNFKDFECYLELVLSHLKEPQSSSLHFYIKNKLIHFITVKQNLNECEKVAEERDYDLRIYETIDLKQKALIVPQVAAIDNEMAFIFIDKKKMKIYNTKIGDYEAEKNIDLPVDIKNQKIISPIYTKNFYTEPRKLGVWTITGNDLTIRGSNLSGEEAIRETMLLISTLSSGVSRIVENFDPLTNLPTRIAIDEQLKATISLYNSKKIDDFALIMFDIDNFKQINDTYGHLTGDLVLETISRRIFESTRKKRDDKERGNVYPDFLARWGGEEFLHLVMTNLDGAVQCAKRFRDLINNIAIDLGIGGILKVSCTFGVSSLKKVVGDIEKIDDEIIERLIKAADDQLYRGKKSGKNCICVDGQDPIRS
ncbi:MAG: GGDEF domain-containing protein [Candidatus Bilamarchaeaceae archaeon]